MKNRTLLILAIIAIVLIGTGIYVAHKKHAAPAPAAAVTDTTAQDLSAQALSQISNIWTLSTENGATVDSDTGTMIITSTGSVTGTFDCSSFSGRANIATNGTATLFKISKLSKTAVQCNKPQPAVETDFYSALQNSSGMNVTQTDSDLSLFGSGFSFGFTQQRP